MAEVYVLLYARLARTALACAIWSGYPTDDLERQAEAWMRHTAETPRATQAGKLPPKWNNRPYPPFLLKSRQELSMRHSMIIAATIMAAVTNAHAQSDRTAAPLLSGAGATHLYCEL
jgi:hypothetical protein